MPSPQLPQRPQLTPEESDEDAPAPPPKDEHPPARIQTQLPTHTAPPRISSIARSETPRTESPPISAVSFDESQMLQSPRGFHLYTVHEMVSHTGKNKKMPTVLGINPSRGIISISPAKQRDGPLQEWSAEKLTHYSMEGKHVFIELIRPSRSLDLHAGAKDTAREIVAGLGELAGAARAGGLSEVIAASSGGSGTKRGYMLYEFVAQGDDEVTVATGDEIIVLDDTKSEEWWMVRRLRNGKEGVVPSSYVEITGTIPPPSPSYLPAKTGRSIVEQNRLDEERLTREAAKSHKRQDSDSLPAEKSRSSRSEGKRNDKPKPNSAKVRVWTDRTASFKVEAEFIGLKDGKIHLHKLNGVKIAVPVNKMSVEDLEYVERATGLSLDEDKPLSDIKRRSTIRSKNQSIDETPRAGISPRPEHDWFDLFLAAGVNPQICERYANAFHKDQMGEEILPDVNPQLLRTLGLKEGDIIRVMKLLDQKFGRVNKDENGSTSATSEGSSGGLFSGPGGALRNNTRKGRPAPAVQTNDNIDSAALKGTSNGPDKPGANVEPPPSSGFDDNAWDVKPAKPSAPISEPVSAAQPKKPQNVMDDLSMLVQPLQPTPTGAQTSQAVPPPPVQPAEPARPSADPAFFDQLGAPAVIQSLQPQTTGRQRPLAPQPTQGSSIIVPPPRAASAPGFPMQPANAMQPQPTGYQIAQQTGFQAPSGQSLQAMQVQQQYNMQQQFAQQTGLQPQPTGFSNGMLPQQTGYGQPGLPSNLYSQPQQVQQQFVNGTQTGSPFADPPRAPFIAQPTGFQQGMQTMAPQQTGFGLPPQQTGGVLGPALQPQPTGFANVGPQSQFGQAMVAQQTGMGSFNGMNGTNGTGMNGHSSQGMNGMNGMNGATTTMMQQQQQQQPLVAQKTGPTPNVRFGVTNGAVAAKLMPQATGRRANLSNASEFSFLFSFMSFSFPLPFLLLIRHEQSSSFHNTNGPCWKILTLFPLQLRRIHSGFDILFWGPQKRALLGALSSIFPTLSALQLFGNGRGTRDSQ